jgi:hypothetical protein
MAHAQARPDQMLSQSMKCSAFPINLFHSNKRKGPAPG